MLTARDLCLERHFEPVFEPLSFDLSAGELMVVTGHNGSGKTTLIRLLAGLIEPTSGTVERATENTRYVGHDAAVKAELTVRENLQFSTRLVGAGDVEAAVVKLGLGECAEQSGRTLSAGQRKRTALARLALSNADLWLLDEPYTNLDEGGIAAVDKLLSSHIAGGGACLMTTHGPHRPAMEPETSLLAYTELVLGAPALAA